MKKPLQALLFDANHRESILDGTKKITIREGHRDYQPGFVLLCCPVNTFCVGADINFVGHQRAGEINQRDYQDDGFPSYNHMIEGMQKYYPNFSHISPITVIRWDNVRGQLVDEYRKRKEKSVYVVCPVRGVSPEEKQFLDNHVAGLEAEGARVHYPPRDVNQDDPTGLRICTEHAKAMDDCKEVHIYWTEKSEGSRFDLGMAFALNKRIRLINPEMVQRTPHKSYANVLLELDGRNA